MSANPYQEPYLTCNPPGTQELSLKERAEIADIHYGMYMATIEILPPLLGEAEAAKTARIAAAHTAFDTAGVGRLYDELSHTERAFVAAMRHRTHTARATNLTTYLSKQAAVADTPLKD